MANFADSQLFQSFATEVAQNDSDWAILPNSQLFQSFPTKVAQNDSEWPISPDLQLFQSFPTEVAQNGQFCMGKIKNTLIQGNFYERLPPKSYGFLVGLHPTSYDWPLCWSIYRVRVVKVLIILGH